jgi:hypothetical protein
VTKQFGQNSKRAYIYNIIDPPPVQCCVWKYPRKMFLASHPTLFRVEEGGIVVLCWTVFGKAQICIYFITVQKPFVTDCSWLRNCEIFKWNIFSEFPHILFIYLFSFANQGRVTTTAYANYCGPFYLTHPVNFPCGRKPEYPGKTHDFRQSVDFYSFHMRTGFESHWEST